MIEPPDDPRIERVRLLYVESDVPMREIAIRTGVHLSTMKNWVKRYQWPARGPRPFGKRAVQGRSGTHAAPPANSDSDSQAAQSPGEEGTAEHPAAGKEPAPAHNPARKRRKSASVQSLVDRLKNIITHQIELMESRMSDDDQISSSDNPERDARALGNIVRSVEKLKELEPDHSKRDAGSVRNSRYPLSPGEEEKLRDEIVERLLNLQQRLRNPSAD
jgi:hypothetical protein